MAKLQIMNYFIKGTWTDTINSLCVFCSLSLNNCEKCDSDSNCTDCDTNYKFYGNPGSFTCVLNCPIG